MSQNTWNPGQYQKNADFVPVLGVPVLDLLGELIGDFAGKRILDLGCGDGVLSAEMIARGATVVGVDASAEMIRSAVEKGIDAHVMDAQVLTFHEEFDAVFTNAVLHWIPNHDLVLKGAFQALKPGGCFVGEFGGHGNVAAIVTALIAVLDRNGHSTENSFRWNYRSPEAFGSQLKSHGFTTVSTKLIPRPTPLPNGMRGWIETMANPFFQGIDTETKARLIDQVVDLLKHSLQDEQGNWTADYIRLRFSALKPS